MTKRIRRRKETIYLLVKIGKLVKMGKTESKFPYSEIYIRKHKSTLLSANSSYMKRNKSIRTGVMSNRTSKSRWATDTLAQFDGTDGKSSGGERATVRSDLLGTSTIPKKTWIII